MAGLAISLRQMQIQAKDSNFILYVSNQSFAIDPVDIIILIDGEPAVDQELYVDGQHNWQKFQFLLLEGKHQI